MKVWLLIFFMKGGELVHLDHHFTFATMEECLSASELTDVSTFIEERARFLTADFVKLFCA